MFTGIVEELGRVKSIARRGKAWLLEIAAVKILQATGLGDSIAVNGVCLTVVGISPASAREGWVSFEVMEITFKNTNLGLLRAGQQVNLERSLKAGERISGHFVLGHVDCLGTIRKKSLRNGSMELEIVVEPKFITYCLPRGSVALDGISLTLAKISASTFTVCIIPHTLKNTTLNFKPPSDKLNIEFDILAKK